MEPLVTAADPVPPPPANGLRAVYARLRDWYQAHAHELLDAAAPTSRRAEAIRMSLAAIDALPLEHTLTDLEVRVALFQVQSGMLNWSGWENIDGQSIRTLVAVALQEAGVPSVLSPADRQEYRRTDGKLRAVFPDV